MLQRFAVTKTSGTGGWLFKEEPDHYSFADLQRDGSTLWNGVDNNLARKHLRNVKVGDRVLYYHTGKEKAVVGEMVVVEGPQHDPGSDDPKAVVVRVRPVRPLPRPVTLASIKQEPRFADWELVKMSRLSVMPVSPEQWQRIEEMAADA
jgi:predicted RNA-binding protein with PUA-like domain